MHTTLSSKWAFLALFLATTLLAGCGVTTKKTFLDEPVQETSGNAVPISNTASNQSSPETLSQNPALNSGEKTGMQKFMNVFTPYRINIQQGNFISQEMLTRVQPGMTKEQVRFALGTPLLTDVFHASRWDYIFRLQKPNGEVTNNRVIVYFQDNRVTRIVNDPLPNETQYLDTVAGPVQKQKTDDSKTTEKTDSSKKELADNATEVVPVVAPVVAPVLVDEETKTEQPTVAESVSDTTSSDVTTQTASSSVATEETNDVPVVATEPVSKSSSYAEPTMNQAPARSSYQDDVEDSLSKESEIAQDSAPINDYDRETTTDSAKTISEESSTQVESTKSYSPEPIRQETYQRAQTVQDSSDEEETDFKAAPNSTMQLHELMQPQ